MAAVAGDAARVGVRLLRAVFIPGSHVAGTISRQPFRSRDAGPADAGRRALVTLASSLAPNGFVLDVAPSVLLPDEHALLMHRLAPARPDPDREWPVRRAGRPRSWCCCRPLPSRFGRALVYCGRFGELGTREP